MIYGEKVKYARDKLGLDRMDFAKLIHSTQQYIAQVENCKDESRRFGRTKEDIILKEASLPPGFFVYGDVKKVEESDDEMFYRLFPNAKDSNAS